MTRTSCNRSTNSPTYECEHWTLDNKKRTKCFEISDKLLPDCNRKNRGCYGRTDRFEYYKENNLQPKTTATQQNNKRQKKKDRRTTWNERRSRQEKIASPCRCFRVAKQKSDQIKQKLRSEKTKQKYRTTLSYGHAFISCVRSIKISEIESRLLNSFSAKVNLIFYPGFLVSISTEYEIQKSTKKKT